VLLEPFDLCYAFAHPPNVAWPAWLARRVRRRPLLYDWCDWYEGGIFPKRLAARRAGLTGGERWLQPFAERREVALERRMIRFADRLTVISEELRALAIRAGRAAQDLLLLPNGADLEGIRPLDHAACRAALGLPEGRLWVGYVANYHPDQELLLAALARAVRVLSDAIPLRLTLLKTGPPLAEKLVRGHGLAGHMHDLGVVDADKIPLVLGAADALVLPLEDNPSNRARVPFKFTDYLAAGRPIASCAVGDLRRWFEAVPGETPIGLAGDPTAEALGASIAALLDPSASERRAAMGAAARRLAEREFAWPRLVDRWESFLADWLGREATGGP
jgi:glycosyltransferase involved in cell wall biosynthesis